MMFLLLNIILHCIIHYTKASNSVTSVFSMLYSYHSVYYIVITLCVTKR